jgi:glutamate-1-semialdehyde 2,1-aminomutase
MERDNTIQHTNEIGEMARTGLRDIVEDLDIAADVTGLGSLFHIHFTAGKVRSARDAEDANQRATLILHERLLNHGIHFYAGRLGFLSGVHGGDDIGYTLNSIRAVIEELQAEGLLTKNQ